MLEALRAGRRRLERVIMIRDGKGAILRDIRQAAGNRGVEIEEVSRQKLDGLAGSDHHQGVVAFAEASRETSPGEILQVARSRGEAPLILALDELKDPQNVGAILRTAYCAGFHGVISTRHRSAPVSVGVDRASAGASEYIPFARVANLRNALVELKKADCWVVGADSLGVNEYTGVDMSRPVAIVLGEEGRGLRELTRLTCDELVRIPMAGRIESLNVSASAAVLCFEALRQRRVSRKIDVSEGR